MLDHLAIIAGKLIAMIIRWFKFGYGGTWPGEITLNISPNILKHFQKFVTSGIILVSGTNGKTTTSALINAILKENNDKVISNISGANLLNGVVSAFLQNCDFFGRLNTDWAVFEIDENSLPIVLAKINIKVQNL